MQTKKLKYVCSFAVVCIGAMNLGLAPSTFASMKAPQVTPPVDYSYDTVVGVEFEDTSNCASVHASDDPKELRCISSTTSSCTADVSVGTPAVCHRYTKSCNGTKIVKKLSNGDLRVTFDVETPCN